MDVPSSPLFIGMVSSFTGAVAGAIFTSLLNMRKKPFSEKISEGTFKALDNNDPEIWSGFREKFKSYNDPWEMEIINLEKFIEVHKNRYKDTNCGDYHFLLFEKNDPKAFENFVKFQSIVHLDLKPEILQHPDYCKYLKDRLNSGAIPESLKHLNVYVNKKDKPYITFFLGKKNRKRGGLDKVALVYFIIADKRKRPEKILQTYDKNTWNELDNTWDDACKGLDRLHGVGIFEDFINRAKC